MSRRNSILKETPVPRFWDHDEHGMPILQRTEVVDRIDAALNRMELRVRAQFRDVPRKALLLRSLNAEERKK